MLKLIAGVLAYLAKFGTAKVYTSVSKALKFAEPKAVGGVATWLTKIGDLLKSNPTLVWTVVGAVGAEAGSALFDYLFSEEAGVEDAVILGALQKLVPELPTLPVSADAIMGDHKAGAWGDTQENIQTIACNLKTAKNNMDWIANTLGIPLASVGELAYRLQAIEPEHVKTVLDLYDN
jgi:hypothetical protein